MAFIKVTQRNRLKAMSDYSRAVTMSLNHNVNSNIGLIGTQGIKLTDQSDLYACFKASLLQM